MFPASIFCFQYALGEEAACRKWVQEWRIGELLGLTTWEIVVVLAVLHTWVGFDVRIGREMSLIISVSREVLPVQIDVGSVSTGGVRCAVLGVVKIILLPICFVDSRSDAGLSRRHTGVGGGSGFAPSRTLSSGRPPCASLLWRRHVLGWPRITILVSPSDAGWLLAWVGCGGLGLLRGHD